jgi:hypothetical protein
MAVLDVVLFAIIAVFVLTIIVKSWARPAPPRAGHSRDPEVPVERPVEGARVLIWGPPLFVAVFAVIMPPRMMYDRVQEFPDFLAYGLLLGAGMEVVLYLCVTRIFVGPVLETFVLHNEGTYSGELEDYYAGEYQRFSRIPLVLAGVLAVAGALALFFTLL